MAYFRGFLVLNFVFSMTKTVYINTSGIQLLP